MINACQKEQTLEDRVNESISEKIETYKNQKIFDCKQEIVELAEIYVDSIMYLEIGTSLQGSQVLPEKPFRFEDTIGYVVELDSTIVTSFEMDTLLD